MVVEVVVLVEVLVEVPVEVLVEVPAEVPVEVLVGEGGTQELSSPILRHAVQSPAVGPVQFSQLM